MSILRTILTMSPILSLLSFAPGGGYGVGDKVDGFDLKNIDDKFVKLSDFNEEKGIIVIFTCNHCPVSMAYEQRIKDLDKKYAPKGFPVVAINPNDPNRYPQDSFENMKKQAAKQNYTFPYLLDDTQQIARNFGATRTPHVFLLKNDGGTFKVAYIGAIDDNMDGTDVSINYIDNAVSALDKGKKVKPSFTKAVGCSIKWRQ